MSYPSTDADVVAEVIAADLGLEAWQVRYAARSALRALAAAGRLTPAGGEARTDYNLRFRKPSDQWCVDEALTSSHVEDDWAHTRHLFGDDVHQVSRTVTEYPDGSYLVGPWLPDEHGNRTDTCSVCTLVPSVSGWARVTQVRCPVHAGPPDTEEETDGR